MSFSSGAQSDPPGSFSQGNAPGVVVRAGKTYLCSACGTLVEVPADVVGQLVIAVNHSPPDEPPTPEPSPPEPPAASALTNDTEGSAVPASTITQAARSKAPSPSAVVRPKTPCPARPRRPKQPRRNAFAGQTIDGLQVPTAKELDRALAWVSFHLKVLDRQHAELKRLKKLLQERSPQKRCAPRRAVPGTHACANVSTTLVASRANDRGPP
ncbi:hypothetical protein [Bremerella sp. P1]|uniref:hypothetical protein n=1 Tax=Bremerella sp. P1 TaxID=3026424 RepID=UPI002368B786|nr:hypothetical protein [Bremerella sp. P1]WDI42399.1 hypothetical protein PSR63_00375 [Bremerella sp. P1]